LIEGVRVYGDNVHIGYFAQHQLEVLDLQASALLHIQRISPTATDQVVRNFLGGFDFHNDKALDPIRDFSGGEKARLALALIVWQRPNLLLLDEPTNHLDIEMRHALTMALQNYEGALLVISHDRHLLRNTVDEFYLVADGTLCEFDGDLKDYQAWLKKFVRDIDAKRPLVLEPVEDKKVARQKAAQTRERMAPITKKIRQLETLMTQLQTDLAQIEAQLADENIYKDEQKMELNDHLSAQIEVKRRLSTYEEQWLECQEALELENN
jgi:ATP-binding cassette subfamily F protein 3